MKRVALTLTLLALTAGVSFADECEMPKIKHSKEFEKLKGLEGKWEGSTMMEGKLQDIAVIYHLTSGGTAVVETLFPGTPHEMVSVYHDEHGKLSMNHYCMLGNQPKLDLTSSSPSEIELNLAKDNSVELKKEDHMHSLRMAFIDNDTMVETWQGIQQGKEKDPTIFKLSRVK